LIYQPNIEWDMMPLSSETLNIIAYILEWSRAGISRMPTSPGMARQ